MIESAQEISSTSSVSAASTREESRLATLLDYGVLDTSPEREYDDIAELAAFICGTPVSLITFVDEDRQWFKAKLGLEVQETPRVQSFCAHTLDTAEMLVVPDASRDPRFASNPLVTGELGIRFYAGAPIIEKSGQVLGSVCVIDREPRQLSPQQLSALQAFSRQVVVLLEQRKAIAELRQAEARVKATDGAIRDSERRLQSFVNSLPALAWIADASGYITWYNDRWYTYTGTTPEQMEGWGWKSVHDPEVLPAVLDRWTGSIQSGQPFEMVFPLRGEDGVFRPFLTRVEPFRSAGGEILHWFGTNVEVDALQKAQLALAKSEETLNQMLKATKDAVVSVNRKWELTYLNPKAELLYGSASTLLGKNLWESFPDAMYDGSPFVEHYYRAMDEGVAGHFEAEYAEPLNFTIGLEVYPTKDGIVTFSRDVTQVKHATAAILQNEKLAAVGRMASTIAHEINNPLEAVTNLIYLSAQSTSVEEAKPFLASADVELRRAAAIVGRTLRFHRQASKPTKVSFPEFLEGIFIGMHSRLKNSRIEVAERDRSSKPVVCLEGEIRQVLVNLVVNAIDAMHGAGGTLYVRGRDGHNWKSGEPGMVITIADTGTGMSQVTMARLFEAFYSTKGIGGTGLGLWISKEILDRHHGCLGFRSSQSQTHSGTVFTVFLPYSNSEEEALTTIKAVL